MPPPSPRLWGASFCRKNGDFWHPRLSSTARAHKREGLEVEILPGDTAQLLCETTSQTEPSQVCSLRIKVEALIWECFPGALLETLGKQIHFGPLSSTAPAHKIGNPIFLRLCKGPLFKQLQLGPLKSPQPAHKSGDPSLEFSHESPPRARLEKHQL